MELTTHSPSTNVNNEWSYIRTPPIHFNDVDMNNFTVQLEAAYYVVSTKKGILLVIYLVRA